MLARTVNHARHLRQLPPRSQRGQAGRSFDDLAREFGREAVFMDAAAIEPGRDFRRAIDEHVASRGVLLCVVGRHWLTLRDESGRRRIDDPTDFVRLKTTSALRRGIPVVPVLVHGATMPTADELPDDLRELTFRNAIQLTHAHWESDMEVLIAALRRLVPSASATTAAATSPAATPLWKRTPVPASLGLFAVILVRVAVWGGAPRDDARTPAQGTEPTRETRVPETGTRHTGTRHTST